MSRQSNSGEVVPERAEIEAVAEAIRGTYVALGTRSGLFGSVGLLDERSRIRIAEVILDRVRDARGDDETTYPPDRLTAGEAPRPAEWEAWQARSPQGEDHEAAHMVCGECSTALEDRGAYLACPACNPSPQGEDHEVVPVPACVREYHAMLAGDVDFLRAQRAKARADIDAARSPQGEDHEAGIEAAITAHYGASERERFERSIAAYLARVSAPKADEKAPSEQNADGG